MLTLESIRECLDGAVPSTVITCAPDGTPNVTYVSQVHFVDASHVALSFQFFNKTRENMLANPRATALVIHPVTAAQFKVEMEYVRTETSGPLFESMKARLAGIASHTGMSGVFRLRGSDIFRVVGIAAVPGKPLPFAPPRRNFLAAVRACAEQIGSASDLGTLLDEALRAMEAQFSIRHAIILMLDASGRKLYTVSSRGYPESGVGSEIALGCGVIGVAAEQRTPIRITFMTAEYSYNRAIRESMLREGMSGGLETAIPLPGLPDSRSQLAVPIMAGRQLLGVIFVESPEDLRFGYEHEDALVTIAAQVGAAIQSLQTGADAQDGGPTGQGSKPVASGPACAIRHYIADDSVFIDDDYLIKGVAGAIFFKLLRDHVATQRSEFSNRELRLDPALRLPDITDNLEARLILLERRLEERRAPMRIEKTGRGRFRLRVDRPFKLAQVQA